MSKTDVKKYTNAGLLQAETDYKNLLADFIPEQYRGLTEAQIKKEYKLILAELHNRGLKQPEQPKRYRLVDCTGFEQGFNYNYSNFWSRV